MFSRGFDAVSMFSHSFNKVFTGFRRALNAVFMRTKRNFHAFSILFSRIFDTVFVWFDTFFMQFRRGLNAFSRIFDAVFTRY